MDIKRSFETFDALLDFAEGATDMREGARASREINSSRNAWAGTRDFDTAIRQARFGWPEGLEKIAAVSDAVNAAIAQRSMTRQEVTFAHSGAVVDIGRFCGGEPECMMNFIEDATAGKKIVQVRVNVAASCSNKPERLFNRGAAVVALVDLLEQNGFSCEIVVFETMSARRHCYTVEAPVKVCGYQLDRDRLAFALCSPAFLRRVLFSVEEREDAATRAAFGIGIGGGYGTPSDRASEFSDAERGVHLGAMHGWRSEFDTQESAVEWALGQARGILELEVAAT
jgi:hypothetical protein